MAQLLSSKGLEPLGNQPETAGEPILSRTRPEDNPRAPTLGGPGCRSERLRSHPSNLIRVIPAKGGAIQESAPAWGITPVPERLRTLGGLENGMLWSSLGLSLLVLVAGAFLVPALSLPEALLAILVGGIFGNALLGGAAAIGAEAGVPAMVLLRAPLGRVGSYLPTGLNVLQNLGWTIFEVLVIATAAQALVHGPLWVWKLAAATAATILALLGPIGFVRVWVKRVALWVVLASLVYLTWWTLHDADLGALWSQPGEGGLSFWQGVDLVVAMPVSWLPLAADYTRFSRSGRGAFWGCGVGYFIPNVWLYALGAILLLSRGLADAPSVIAAIAAGGAGAAVALVALGVDETKEPFANIYSAAVSVQNVLPRVPQRLLILAVAAVATAGTFVIDLVNYQSFLYLLGSFFVPLFGVLLAQWIAGERDPFAAPRFRPGQIVAWLAGFCLYQWLAPVGPSSWIHLVDHTHPGQGAIGGSLPSFALAFALSLGLTLANRASARRDRPSVA
jgi:putative hydroxymethylpyrimidine transporter CytX